MVTELERKNGRVQGSRKRKERRMTQGVCSGKLKGNGQLERYRRRWELTFNTAIKKQDGYQMEICGSG